MKNKFARILFALLTTAFITIGFSGCAEKTFKAENITYADELSNFTKENVENMVLFSKNNVTEGTPPFIIITDLVGTDASSVEDFNKRLQKDDLTSLGEDIASSFETIVEGSLVVEKTTVAKIPALKVSFKIPPVESENMSEASFVFYRFPVGDSIKNINGACESKDLPDLTLALEELINSVTAVESK